MPALREKSSRTHICRFALCLLLCTWASTGLAGLVKITSSTFSAPLGATGTAAIIGLTPFDPALGTLDSVNVTLNGAITVLGLASPFRDGFGTALPYSYQVNVTQDFDGLADQFFDFDSDALLTLTGSASGAGEPFSLSAFFSYGFTFDSTTDLVGFTFPSFSASPGILSPPTGISGTRADFLASIVSLNQIALIESVSAGLASPVPVSVSGISTSGALLVQYNYTPTSVPEPTPLALMAIGAAALGFSRRRQAHVSDRDGVQ